MAKSYCDNCVYSRLLSASNTRICNYIFIKNEKRPCPAGEGCTVKVVRKRSRRKNGEENG